MSQSLCTYCENLAGAWLVPRFYDLRDSVYPAHTEPVKWSTHGSWEDLISSAETCELCAMIAREAGGVIEGAAKGGVQGAIQFQVFAGSRLEIRCEGSKGVVKLNVGFDGADIARAPANAHGLFGARIVSKRTGDARNIKTVQHWLSVCKSSHQKCSTWNSSVTHSRHLATRVLDVDGSHPDVIKLALPTDTDVSDYVALSYCWGPTGNPYKTDDSNIDLHLTEGFSVDKLPRTLRDAVELTRSAGIRFLWIDALCIIQGNHEDWLREAARMSTVYSRALFTISANAAVDTSTGLFLKRSPRHGISVRLPWPLETPGDGLGPMALHVTPGFRTFREDLAESPLTKRGWTFQERVLSSRILHIGSELCYWECKEACIGEDQEIGDYSVQDTFSNFKDLLLPTESTADIPNHRYHDKWEAVISQFSTRQLTNGNDIFAALEGVASAFGAKNKLGKYFCGLWEEEILRHLLWQTSRSNLIGRRAQRPPSYRAPSWSWASVDAPVENPAIKIYFHWSRQGSEQTSHLGQDGLLSYKLLKIREIKVETEGSTGFGPVVEAFMQATGYLLPVKLAYSTNPGIWSISSREGDMIGMATWDTDEEPDSRMHVWLCPVMQRQKIEGGWAFSECLVLRVADVNYGGEMTFERVGRARAKNIWVGKVVEQDFTIL